MTTGRINQITTFARLTRRWRRTPSSLTTWRDEPAAATSLVFPSPSLRCVAAVRTPSIAQTLPTSNARPRRAASNSLPRVDLSRSATFSLSRRTTRSLFSLRYVLASLRAPLLRQHAALYIYSGVSRKFFRAASSLIKNASRSRRPYLAPRRSPSPHPCPRRSPRDSENAKRPPRSPPPSHPGHVPTSPVRPPRNICVPLHPPSKSTARARLVAQHTPARCWGRPSCVPIASYALSKVASRKLNPPKKCVLSRIVCTLWQCTKIRVCSIFC